MRSYHVTCAITLLVAGFFLVGCKTETKPKEVFDMGDRVKVGPLTYSVLETLWKSQLGEFPMQRIPERNFLLVHVSVTNSGGAESAVPGLTVENSSGTSYLESPDGKNVPKWFGVLRTIAPAATEDGWLLFDVPTSSYRLRVVGTEKDGTDRAALIHIPLTLTE